MFILSQDGKEMFNIKQFLSISNTTLDWLEKPYIIRANLISSDSKKGLNLGTYKDKERANDIFKALIRSVKAGDEVFVMPEE